MLLSLLAGTVAEAAPRIVGGTLATQPWPAQGFLRLTTSAGDYLCGGTLVSSRWFLTAGHCVTNADGTILAPAAFTITLGKPDLTQATAADDYKVDKVIRHASFSTNDVIGSADYDVALLHLSPAKPAPPQQPLRLIAATETSLWAPGTNSAIIGWGTTCEAATCGTSNQLRQAVVPIVSDAVCGSSSSYGPFFNPATMLCAGNFAHGGVDTCSGDSGGPLMVLRQGEFTLAGVTSWGNGCAEPGYPGVYARIGAPALNQWARDRIPTASISAAPAAARPGDPVTLTAAATNPTLPAGTATPAGAPVIAWDLNDNGVYDDATGAVATLPGKPAGTYVVRAQATYPDGDRAPARELVAVAEPAPPPQPPALVVTPPPAVTPPARAIVALASLINVPSSVSVASLLDGRENVRVRCSASCQIAATLRLDGVTAKKIGLRKNTSSAAIGSGGATYTTAKTANVAIKIGKRAIARLRKAGGGTLTLRVSVSSGKNSVQLKRTQKLHR